MRACQLVLQMSAVEPSLRELARQTKPPGGPLARQQAQPDTQQHAATRSIPGLRPQEPRNRWLAALRFENKATCT